MLQELLKGKNLILASGSPRRKTILQNLGLRFEIRTKEIDEHYPPHLRKEEISDFLAQLKAKSFTDSLKPNEILITSDTIVWHKEKALGKPRDFDEACEMLKGLSGSRHSVLSSVALTTIDSQIVINEETFVWFKELNRKEIEYYVQNFKPYDKAGAYGIQEWIGYIGIDKIEGSYFNVMGFPVQKFYEALVQMNS